MSQNLQNFLKFQKFQLGNLVDFEKCCKTHIFLQKSEPIQPKTSNILPKFCQPTLSDDPERQRASYLGAHRRQGPACLRDLLNASGAPLQRTLDAPSIFRTDANRSDDISLAIFLSIRTKTGTIRFDAMIVRSEVNNSL